MNELLVVLSGKMGSGKSTVAEGLCERFGFHTISIGTMIKKVSTLLIDQPNELKSYLRNVLKEEKPESFEELYSKLITLYRENFTDATWEKDEAGNYTKNESYRDLTQFVATYFRDLYSQDIWVRFIASDAMELATSGERVVCDDLRDPSEKRILEMFGFMAVRLDISKEEQKRRLQERYGTISEELLNHPTETALDDAHFDYRFSVDGMSVEEQREKVYRYLKLV